VEEYNDDWQWVEHRGGNVNKVKNMEVFLMKKIIFALLVLFVTGVGTGFAAPINSLDKGQTAVGIVDDDFYAEHKLTDVVTLGFQEHDIYGQYNFNGNFRAIAGNRNYHGSNFYIGAAVNTALAPALDGYVSLIAGSDFTEAQVGVNYNLTENVDINVNYRTFRPDEGRDRNRTGIGATFKF
jgi:hypothetical protein